MYYWLLILFLPVSSPCIQIGSHLAPLPPRSRAAVGSRAVRENVPSFRSSTLREKAQSTERISVEENHIFHSMFFSLPLLQTRGRKIFLILEREETEMTAMRSMCRLQAGLCFSLCSPVMGTMSAHVGGHSQRELGRQQHPPGNNRWWGTRQTHGVNSLAGAGTDEKFPRGAEEVVLGDVQRSSMQERPWNSKEKDRAEEAWAELEGQVSSTLRWTFKDQVGNRAGVVLLQPNV